MVLINFGTNVYLIEFFAMIAVRSSTDLWTYLSIPNILQMTGVSNLVTRFNLHKTVYNDL